MIRFLFLIVGLVTVNAQVSVESRIDAILDSNYDVKGDGPGISLIVLKKNKRYYASRGLANLEYKIKFDKTTVFDIASITKQFTSACIGLLQKQKLLNIDDDVRKYIPELKFYGDTIRVKHLLNHTSGIRNHNILLDLKGFDYKHSGYTNEIIQELMFHQEGVNNNPGERVLYSNTNYVLLALIIERVSGQPISEFAKKNLFEPLEMFNTFYQTDLDNIIKNKAYEYYEENGTYKNPKSLTLCVGAGGVISSLSDLALWSLIFTSNKFPYLKNFLTTRESLLDGSKTEIARGVFVSPYKGYETINHGGRGFGMRAYLISIPKIELSVIIYANLDRINVENIAYEIIDTFIPKTNPPLESKKVEVSNSYNHKVFSGEFQELNSDLIMKFSVENDTLKVKNQSGNSMIPLVPVAKGIYSRKDNSSVVYNFNAFKNVDMTINFGGGLFYFERVNLVNEGDINLNEYAGTYISKELDVTYEFSLIDDTLTLNYKNNTDIKLQPLQRNTFGSGRRVKYHFTKAKNGIITGLKVSAEGTVKDIIFKKI